MVAKRINCRVRSTKGLEMDMVAKNLKIPGVIWKIYKTQIWI
jgi:hypothetical protein